MTAREIDALLATHLFHLDATKRDVAVVHALGMNNRHETRIYDVAAAPWTLSMGKQPISMWVVPGGPGDYQEIEPYSTTGDGMLAVVQAMRAKDWLLETGHLPCEEGCYAVFRLITVDPMHEDWAAVAECEKAETIQMAVSLAALRALVVDVEVAP